MKRWVLVIVSVFLATMSNGATACITRHMTFDEALDLSHAVIIGEISEIGPEQENQFRREREYKVRVLDTVRVLNSLAGSLQPNDQVDVDLVQFFARPKADGAVDCSLLRGSGREGDFRVGERYVLLLKREEGRFELYWSNRWIEKSLTGGVDEGTIVARFPEPTKIIHSTTNAWLTYFVENQGAESVTVNPDLLGSAIFAVQVFDNDERMLTTPPGVPPIDDEPSSMTLIPGQKLMFLVSLNVFSGPLPAGTYVVRINYPGISVASETLRLIVMPGD